ncbi:MAG: phosphopantothenoylcysteine decarboxylase [Actinomycetota bacterium]|nr:MAG: phosphopantothenoylcysteine decarboxylase [Actinomycetota bacterium]
MGTTSHPRLEGRRVLLGVTGGIAAYKAAIVARGLVTAGAEVTAVLTEVATRFIGPDTFAALTGRPAHTTMWERPGEVLHVRLARTAEAACVAPATANAIARLAHGLADDLLSATLLEFSGPLVVAPAMHAGMWTSPLTRSNLDRLGELLGERLRVVGPDEGPLAAGDEGPGRMAEPERIVEAVAAALGPRDLLGRRIVVTAGPTHEPIDPVRYLGNRSSGTMGIEVAREAAARGARVTLVLGPGSATPPVGVEVVRIETAEQLRDAVLARAAQADAVVMAAAVADFRPKDPSAAKLRREQGPPELLLEPTPDVLAELTASGYRGIVVGFAAETEDVEARGREKLRTKGLDLVVANLVGREGTGFGSPTNEAAILAADGRDRPIARQTKAELAAAICDRLAELLAR